MKREEVIKFFGTEAEAARKLGISKQAVNVWPEKMIPERSALLAQAASSGALKFDADAYRERRLQIAAKARGKKRRRIVA